MTQRSASPRSRWNLNRSSSSSSILTKKEQTIQRLAASDSNRSINTASTSSSSSSSCGSNHNNNRSLDSILCNNNNNNKTTLSSRRSIRQRLSDRRNKKKKAKKSVSFGVVETREYAVILGDNPTILGGFPLGLDWRFNIRPTQSVNQHLDQQRQRRRAGGVGATTIFDKDPKAAPLTSEQRKAKLQCMGFSREEIWAQERRRKVIVTSEWAYGTNEKLPSFRPQALVSHYVV